eukprot:2039588-Rhodomonas_salina.3
MSWFAPSTSQRHSLCELRISHSKRNLIGGVVPPSASEPRAACRGQYRTSCSRVLGRWRTPPENTRSR